MGFYQQWHDQELERLKERERQLEYQLREVRKEIQRMTQWDKKDDR